MGTKPEISCEFINNSLLSAWLGEFNQNQLKHVDIIQSARDGYSSILTFDSASKDI